MNKIVSIKNTSEIFLAIVLIAGTIALSPTFFMVGTAQASSDHEKDYDKYDKKSYTKDRYDDRKSSYDGRKSSYEKDNYKSTEYPSYGKDNSYPSKDSGNVIVKKVKCNNINVNLNGFNGIEVNAVPPSTLNALATDEAQAADEGEIGASSFGSGGGGSDSGRPSGSDSDSRYVCINNNDFEVVTPPEPPDTITCEECFMENVSPEVIQDINDRNFFLWFIGGEEFRVSGIEGMCSALQEADATALEIFNALLVAGIDSESALNVVLCLEDVLDFDTSGLL